MITPKQIKQQLDITNQLIESIKSNPKQNLSELPAETKQLLNKLPLSKELTSSGLEKVDYIYTRLLVSQYYLKEAYKDPEGFKKRYSQKQDVQKTINNNPDLSVIPKKAEKIAININPSPTNIKSQNINTQKNIEPIKTTIPLNEKNNASNQSIPHIPQDSSNTPPPSSNIKI